MKEEFDLLQVPFETRGSMTDEYLEAFRELWSKDRPSYSGKHVCFSDVLFHPKPLQKPHPPLWIGGGSSAGPRRALQFADGWDSRKHKQHPPPQTPAPPSVA